MKHPTWFYLTVALSVATIAFCVAFWTNSQPSEGWVWKNGAFVDEQHREMCQLMTPGIMDSAFSFIDTTTVIVCIDFKTGMKGTQPLILPR